MTNTRAYLWISHNPLRLFVAAFLLGAFVDLVTPFSLFSYGVQFVLGMPLFVCGAALTVWASEAGKRKPSVPEAPPVEFHQAAHEPPFALRTGGPYRYLRHPYYLSLAMMYAGVGVMLDWPCTLLLLLPVLLILDRAIMPREEVELERLYGDKWLAYKAAVPRWGYGRSKRT